MMTKGSRTWLGLGTTALLVCCPTALAAFKGLLLRVIGIAAVVAVLAYVVIPGLLVLLLSFDNPALELARAFR